MDVNAESTEDLVMDGNPTVDMSSEASQGWNEELTEQDDLNCQSSNDE